MCSTTARLAKPTILFFFTDTATTEIYTLSLHDALPIYIGRGARRHAVLGIPSIRHRATTCRCDHPGGPQREAPGGNHRDGTARRVAAPAGVPRGRSVDGGQGRAGGAGRRRRGARRRLPSATYGRQRV